MLIISVLKESDWGQIFYTYIAHKFARGKEKTSKASLTCEPDQTASRHCGRSSKPEGAEWKAQNDEAVQRDEADDEGRHLGGQQRQDASNSTRLAGCPGFLVPQVLATVQQVSHPYHGQVHAHQEIGQTQVGHEDVEAGFGRSFLYCTPENKTTHIPDDRHDTNHPEKQSVDVLSLIHISEPTRR